MSILYIRPKNQMRNKGLEKRLNKVTTVVVSRACVCISVAGMDLIV